MVTGVLFAIGANSPETLRPIPRNFIDWIPDLLVAGLLVLGGYADGVAVATTLGKALNRAAGQNHFITQGVIHWSIVGSAVILALGQLGVRTTVLLVITAGLILGIAATLTLLAGLGVKDVAAHIAASRTPRTDCFSEAA